MILFSVFCFNSLVQAIVYDTVSCVLLFSFVQIIFPDTLPCVLLYFLFLIFFSILMVFPYIVET